ncbi:S8 family serine peptidase [Glycomyces paridis]|uniref:Peptidase S8/S53 domain-containing protein n=1 Tax=Glycomyces paridis TaxID=2126555 RepID=A0A4S8PMB9_9ACTN|nr:S8 family serine peptidase [Glycomyces paridis]THV31998.1 hypothetical protein E9998_00640 [Glycomyces paridis]
MTRRRWRTALAGATAGALALAGASPAFAEDATAQLDEKADPALIAEIDAEGEAEAWIRFQGGPDFSDAFDADAKTDKGTAAVEAAQAFATSSQAEATAVLEEAGAAYESYWASSSIRVTADADLLAELAALDSVAGIDAPGEYAAVEPVEEAIGVQAAEWGLTGIGADDVWDMGIDGNGVVIASIDSGVDYTHPALVDQYRGNNHDGTFTHDYNFFDVQGTCGGVPCDTDGHGTHTMGTMVGDDGQGNQIGVAPGAQWISVNGCCPSREGLIAAGQWIAAPTDLAGNNADPSKAPDIVNNSWGASSTIYDPYYEAVVALWHAAGIIPVFSAGNSGSYGCESTNSPSTYSDVIAVGAYDSTGLISPQSSKGPGVDGQNKPDIAAPGLGIRSAVPGGGYGYRSGTSMAAPHVSGTIALMISAAPSLAGDYQAVYDILAGSAVDVDDTSCGGTAEVNNVYGHGRLDAFAAFTASPVVDFGAAEGTVTDSLGAPLEDVKVAFTGDVTRTAVTAADGTYAIPALPADDYVVTIEKFWYATQTYAVTVPVGVTTTVDSTLATRPTGTITGTVTDGSGQGWPLAASVSNAGGQVSVETDPATGQFSITLPVDQWDLVVEAAYPGYSTQTVTASTGGSVPVALTADSTCTAPGYGYATLGENFETGALPEGWTVVNRGEGGWAFQSVRANSAGTGGFAIGDGAALPGGALLDTDLISPVFDLSSADSAQLTFGAWIASFLNSGTHDVSISTDGGATWEPIWDHTGTLSAQTVTVDLSAWAASTETRLKFHFGNNNQRAFWWQLDDVLVGTAGTCAPVDGGLVLGEVTAAGAAVEGATVLHAPSGYNSATGADGSYWMFVPATGATTLEAAKTGTGTDSGQFTLVNGAVTIADFTLT